MNIPLLTVIILLTAASAYFSFVETAFLSSSEFKLKTLVSDGGKTGRRAARVLKILERYDRFICAVLVGNNIVNITLASLGTVFFALYFEGNKATTVSTIVITLAVLFIGETTPKMIAKRRSERFSMALAPSVRVLMLLLLPFTAIFSLWNRLLIRLIGDDKKSVSHKELITMVDEAQDGGGIGEGEGEIIRSAIETHDTELSEILTPRVDIIAVERGAGMKKIRDAFISSRFSRLPVYEGDLDHIIGVINQKDFYERVVYGRGKLDGIITPVKFVTETTRVLELLKIFQRDKISLAVVADDRGGTVGIVSMDDLLEEIVGEIWDESDEVSSDITEVSKGEYLVSCDISIDIISEKFGLNEEYEISTVGGWVMEMLEKIPEEGDSFVCAVEDGELLVTVTRVKGNRVEEIRVIHKADRSDI